LTRRDVSVIVVPLPVLPIDDGNGDGDGGMPRGEVWFGMELKPAETSKEEAQPRRNVP
jgi:hypothetical protein